MTFSNNSPSFSVDLINAAKTQPNKDTYQALISCADIRTTPDDLVAFVFQTLDFENPPISLHDWYVVWFHSVKTKPQNFEHLAGNQDSAVSLLVTLGLATGFGFEARSLTSSVIARETEAGATFAEKSRYYGEKWLRSAVIRAQTDPKMIVSMLGLIMLKGLDSDAKYGPGTGSSHPVWTGSDAPDLSAHVFKQVFSQSHVGLVDMVLDMHENHWERCATLRKLFTEQVVPHVTVPNDVSDFKV